MRITIRLDSELSQLIGNPNNVSARVKHLLYMGYLYEQLNKDNIKSLDKKAFSEMLSRDLPSFSSYPFQEFINIGVVK